MSTLEIRRCGDAVHTYLIRDGDHWEQSPQRFLNHGLNIDQLAVIGARRFIHGCTEVPLGTKGDREALEGAIDGFRCLQGIAYLGEVRDESPTAPFAFRLLMETAERNPTVDEWMLAAITDAVPAVYLRKSLRRAWPAPVDAFDWCRLGGSLNAISLCLEARWLGEGLNQRLMGVGPAMVDNRR